ncbi:MAG: hypothetical protein GY860_26920 [Desulfobacteraceae bacterium]|nr:hypothetical protein [Desulfobacteraceae bacterium]
MSTNKINIPIHFLWMLLIPIFALFLFNSQYVFANSINVFNGNNYQAETDIAFNSPFKGGFTFKRSYNSRSTDDSTIGFGWNHNYNFVLIPNFGGSDQLIKIIGSTGRGIYFDDNDVDGIFTGAFSENSSISKDQDDNYIRTIDDGTVLKFDGTTGAFLSITDKSGNIQSLSYNTDNLLETVTDQATGRSLTFYYTSDNKIDHISGPVTQAVPDGVWVSYSYDANDNLTGVQYADDGNGSGDSGFEYLYEDTNDPNNLTTKKDLGGTVLSTWTYNTSDQAVSNTNTQGTGATINYDDPNEVAVTDAYGITTIYSISEIAGRKKITQATKPNGCTNCSDGIYQTSFDETTGYPIQREYFNGRIDLFQNYDANNNPQTTIISQGTTEEKNIQKTYHPTLSIPMTLVQKSLLADTSNPDRIRDTTWDYDDPTASGNTDIPNENPTNSIYRMTEYGFTLDYSGAVIPYDRITAYTYTAKGQVSTIDGPLAGDQDRITFVYDADTGDLLSMTRPLAGTTTFTHDTAGNIISAVDENQVQTLFSYDGRNRQVSETSDGASTSQTFTAAGTLASQTDRAGRAHTLTYDTKGFLQRLTNPAGDYQLYAYDENANPIESSLYFAEGIQTLFSGYAYGDPASDASLSPGKPAKALTRNQENTANVETLFAYEHGNLVRITDPMATTKDFVYDSLNRLTESLDQQTDEIFAQTLYAYDLADNLIQVTDPENRVTAYTYDDANRMVKQVSPDTGTTLFFYDEANNLVARQKNDGTYIQYTYDELGRRTGIQYPDADQDVLFFYDQGINGKGRLTELSHSGDAYAFGYDALGHLIRVERTTAGTTFTTTYGYDAAGLLTEMVYPDGRTITYEHNPGGEIVRVTTVRDGITKVLAENMVHLPFGPLAAMTLGSGQEVSTGFDRNYRPDGIVAPGVLDQHLTYDLSGRITAITDLLDTSRSQGFGYDRAGKLTSATGAYGSIGFTYDKTGNRLTRTMDGALLSYDYTPGTNRMAGITGPDSQTDITYDDNGNIITKGDKTFAYNQAGRLLQVSQQENILGEYLYNSFGQRTQKTAENKTTLYHYDILGNLIGESTPSGDFFMDYVYVNNTRLASLASDPDNVFEVRVSTSTGRTIEGIKVYAFTEAGTYSGIYGTTDISGVAVFQKAQLTADTYKFRADYLNEQFWTPVAALASGSTSLIIQEIDQTVTIIQNSSPLSGITVYVFDENNRYLGISGITDAAGHVIFALPLGQDYTFRADILGQQFFSEIITASEEETTIDSQGGLLTFELNRDNAVPITGVKAYLFSEAGQYLGKSSTTDSQGLALFELPAGSYKIRCDYMGYQFWSQVIPVTTSSSASLTIPHKQIALTALKTHGASSAATGIKTYLFTESGTYMGISQTTDDQGQALFLVPEKPYKIRGDYLSVQYWSPVFTWTDPGITIAQGNIQLDLTNAGQPLADVKTYVFTTEGQYLDISSVSDAQGRVFFTLPQGSYTFRSDWLDNQYWSQTLIVTANEQTLAGISTGGGTITLTAKKDEQTVLPGIKAYLFAQSGTYLGQQASTNEAGQVAFTLGNGTYKIRLDYLGYQFWTQNFTIPDDTGIDLIIPHNAITASIATANNGQTSPLADIKTYLFTESGTYMGIQALTDADGNVSFDLPEKSYKIRADYMGGQYWSGVFTTTGPVVEIPQGRALVRVGPESAPLAGVKVYLFSENDTYMGMNTLTDANGMAGFDLPQGTWKFRADYLGSQYWATGSVLPDQDNALEINPGGGSLGLALEKSPGSPLADIKVYAFSGAGTYLGQSATTGDQGLVSFDLPEGDYKFRADYLGYQFWTDVLSMPGTSSHTLTIPHEDVTITLQGQYQNSFPIQGAKTYLFTGSGTYQGISSSTDTNGQVTYSLPEKSYKFRADYLSGQYWSDETIQSDKTITLDHGTAQVNVTQSGSPISGARVYLFTQAGSYLGQSANTDTSGNAGFTLPIETYKFRIDHDGSQYWSDPVDLIAAQATPIDLNLDSLALNLTANPHYARVDGEMPQKEEGSILLASIGSLAGYVDNGNPQPGVSYYINDHLGTPIKIIDDEGQVVWDGAYLPFGRADTGSSDAQNQFRFPGQYYDGETGLHYNWHRYYDPDTGRYLTPDPIGLAGGINPFVYAMGNPVNAIDPLGLSSWFPVPGNKGWDYRKDQPHHGKDYPHEHFRHKGKDIPRKVDPATGEQKPHGKGKCQGPDKDVPQDVVDSVPRNDFSIDDLEYWEKVTGLTGTALIIYLIISEGSRAFPPRNLVPIP